MNVEHFKNYNFRIEIGTAVAKHYYYLHVAVAKKRLDHCSGPIRETLEWFSMECFELKIEVIFATDPSSETQGQAVRSGERFDERFQARAEVVSLAAVFWMSEKTAARETRAEVALRASSPGRSGGVAAKGKRACNYVSEI